MLIKIYPENPNQKHIARIIDVLESDGVIIYPTDGVYAFGCSIRSPKAFERLRSIKDKNAGIFSIMCADISQISDYARVDNHAFRILKRNLPGPFTFILNASSRVPDKVLARRKTIGVRIAANNIPAAIIRELGAPLVTASVKEHDEIIEYTTDPELLHEEWSGMVDMVVDGGFSDIVPTTLVDLAGDEPDILREGGGELLF